MGSGGVRRADEIRGIPRAESLCVTRVDRAATGGHGVTPLRRDLTRSQRDPAGSLGLSGKPEVLLGWCRGTWAPPRPPSGARGRGELPLRQASLITSGCWNAGRANVPRAFWSQGRALEPGGQDTSHQAPLFIMKSMILGTWRTPRPPSLSPWPGNPLTAALRRACLLPERREVLR